MALYLRSVNELRRFRRQLQYEDRDSCSLGSASSLVNTSSLDRKKYDPKETRKKRYCARRRMAVEIV